MLPFLGQQKSQRDKENQVVDTVNNNTGHSNNSNMSLTMTELNILKPVVLANKEPGILEHNLTNNTLLNTNNLTSSNKMNDNNPVNTNSVSSAVSLKSRQVRVNGKFIEFYN